jgi:hypothetical protein
VRVTRTKLSSRQQRTQRLQLYGLVQGFSYVIGLNDFKIAQRLRARLAGVLRRPHDLVKPLQDDLEDLLEISGLWVRNVGNRHEIKLQIRRLISRIIPRLRYRRPVRRRMSRQ